MSDPPRVLFYSLLPMHGYEDTKDGGTLRAFIEKPHDRERFDQFFKLTHRLARSYLYYLTKFGWRMPADLYSGDNLISDVANDILGSFLGSKKNRPFYIIFDYFRDEAGCLKLPESDEELLSLLKALFFGFIRQELSKLSDEQNPQVANLKRRFKDILKSPPYKTLSEDGHYSVLVYHGDYRGDLRLYLHLIPDDALLGIVEEAYLGATSRSEWCQRIFQLIAKETEYRNYIEKHRLISAVVAVNLRQVDTDGLFPTSLPSPEEERVYRAIGKALEESLTWARDNAIRPFVTKGRITLEESERLCNALRLYLTDFAWHGEADKLPVYFRQTMPEEAHGRYLKDYKFIFDMIVSKTIEDFRARLRKELQ